MSKHLTGTAKGELTRQSDTLNEYDKDKVICEILVGILVIS